MHVCLFPLTCFSSFNLSLSQNSLLHLLFCSHLVATDRNFQSIYDAVMMQMVVFIVYVCLRESMKAGRCVVICIPWLFCLKQMSVMIQAAL